ncbi:hypothetical protein O3M35_001617 [Rhynocoris fuscipes]|uniref:MHC class I antigen n=1 Tax=Rhynocoris fuscipes TaxID=488301 RepID=A0AAW1CPJ6_9HEMI
MDTVLSNRLQVVMWDCDKKTIMRPKPTGTKYTDPTENRDPTPLEQGSAAIVAYTRSVSDGRLLWPQLPALRQQQGCENAE